MISRVLRLRRALRRREHWSEADLREHQAREAAALRKLLAGLGGLICPAFSQARSATVAVAHLVALLAVAGDRNSCWQLGEQAGHATPRRMQALLAEYAWDWRVVLERLQRFILAHLADPDAILGIPTISIGIHDRVLRRRAAGTRPWAKIVQILRFTQAPGDYCRASREHCRRAGRQPGPLGEKESMRACCRCKNAAGFWVIAQNARVARRPWCLSCITEFLNKDEVTMTRIAAAPHAWRAFARSDRFLRPRP